MSIAYKYQQDFAAELTQDWNLGKHEYVRSVIRNLKNKAQAAYIAARVAANLSVLSTEGDSDLADLFAEFMHPNN